MTEDSLAEKIKQVQQEREREQEETHKTQLAEMEKLLDKTKSDFRELMEENRKTLEKSKDDFQKSLLAESRNSRNCIEVAERKLRRFLWVTLATILLAQLTCVLFLTATNRSVQQLKQEAQAYLEERDQFSVLRDQHLIPVGKPMTLTNGIEYIEVQKIN